MYDIHNIQPFYLILVKLMIYTLKNRKLLTNGEDFWVAPTASVIGSVELGKDVGIWFGAVLRGDNDPIIIGANSNVQDNTVCHTDPGIPVKIGKGVTIGHTVILHSCEIGDNSLIGMGATILNNVKIGSNCIIGANTLITEGKVIPENSVVIGSPGKVVRATTDKEKMMIKDNADHYVSNWKRFKGELKEL